MIWEKWAQRGSQFVLGHSWTSDAEKVWARNQKKNQKKKSTKQVKTQNAEHNTPTYAQKDYETVHYLDLNGRQHL